MNHFLIAHKFKKLARSPNIEKPDIMVVSMPSVLLCNEAVKFAKENNIPVVVDLRDMWPDIFADRAPKMLKK